jgi:hypothetical protein
MEEVWLHYQLVTLLLYFSVTGRLKSRFVLRFGSFCIHCDFAGRHDVVACPCLSVISPLHLAHLQARLKQASSHWNLIPSSHPAELLPTSTSSPIKLHQHYPLSTILLNQPLHYPHSTTMKPKSAMLTSKGFPKRLTCDKSLRRY